MMNILGSSAAVRRLFPLSVVKTGAVGVALDGEAVTWMDSPQSMGDTAERREGRERSIIALSPSHGQLVYNLFIFSRSPCLSAALACTIAILET